MHPLNQWYFQTNLNSRIRYGLFYSNIQKIHILFAHQLIIMLMKLKDLKRYIPILL